MQEREGDYGFAGISGFGYESAFQFMRNRHFAGGDLRFARAHEAELAAAQGIALTHTRGRSKHAAGHGPPVIDIAKTRCRVEGRTRCVVGKIFKASLLLF